MTSLGWQNWQSFAKSDFIRVSVQIDFLDLGISKGGLKMNLRTQEELPDPVFDVWPSLVDVVSGLREKV